MLKKQKQLKLEKKEGENCMIKTQKKDFFSKEVCDRCGAPLKNGRIMSMYNEDCICIKCKVAETKRSDYADAVRAVEEAHKRGDDMFKGIGLKKEDR